MIDYGKLISDVQLENAIEFYDFHDLSGGTFRTVMCDIDPIYGSKVMYSATFSDKCDCKVKHKCNKTLPLIFSNN